MSFCTSAEGQKFQQSAIKFDKKIKEMGPNPLRLKAQEKNGTPTKGKVKA